MAGRYCGCQQKLDSSGLRYSSCRGNPATASKQRKQNRPTTTWNAARQEPEKERHFWSRSVGVNAHNHPARVKHSSRLWVVDAAKAHAVAGSIPAGVSYFNQP